MTAIVLGLPAMAACVLSIAGQTGIECSPMGAGPGTRLVFEGFYKTRFQLGDAVGRSVMHVGNGKMLGGNSAFAHIGTYERTETGVDIVIKTVRHNPDPNYRAMAGTDDATLLAKGWPDGD